ncbi:MAG: apolipoprotein N-acyltransferase, partial [bacterium]
GWAAEARASRTAAWAAFAGILALYWAAWAAIVCAAGPRRGALLAPALWAVLEWARGWGSIGFPWVELGASQWAFSPVFQGARAFGVHAVSAAVVAVNVALWAWVRPRRALAGLSAGSAGVWLAGLALAAAVTRIPAGRAGTGAPLRVAALQGSFTEEEKWSLPLSTILGRFEDLALKAEKSDLMIWPETATAEIWEEQPEIAARARRLAVRTGAAQLIGSVQRGKDGRFHNAVVLVTAGGEAGRVMKRHLVPFGEYIPGWFRRFAPFARKLTSGVVDFSPGEASGIIEIPGGPRCGVLVCYEANFSGLVRDQVRAGAEVLVNVTNDAWYRRTAATWQHALGPVCRAVEYGRWLVRCANTGVSFIAGPDGGVWAPVGVFVPGVVAGTLPPLSGATPYALWGEWPLILAGAAAWAAGRARRR